MHNTLKVCLAPRQFETASFVAKGYSNREIASAMGIQFETIRTNLTNIYEKAGVRNRTELAVRYALEEERGLYASI